jgi:sortase A
MPWRRIVGGVGRVFIGIGALLLLFVAYQLWGTNIQESRAQHRLSRQFERALEQATAPPVSGGPTTTTEPPLPPPTGEGVAVLEIPKIGVHKTVVQGVGVPDLKKGPGHYPDTPMPGQVGNAAIAGHRTTYGAPFFRLNELDVGDEIRVRTLQGEFTYAVTTTQVVRPNQLEVLTQTPDAILTLTTCDPRFSARRRLVVQAELQDEPAPSPSTTTTTTPPGQPAATPEPVRQPGLSGDRTARWPTIVYGAITALIGLLVWLVHRRWRRWWVYLAGAPVFLVALFVFFENVSRLLPANI